jgi:hypothetical protein
MTIRNTYSLIGITALLIGLAVIFFSRQNSHEGKIFLQAVPVQTDSGWGYQILAGDRVYIKQEYIPGLPGRQGFKSSADAMRVGSLVVKKITSNQLPTITEKELDSLGIIRKQ